MNLNVPKLLAADECQERKRVGEVTQIMPDGLIEVTLTDGTLLIGKVGGGATVGTPVYNRPQTYAEQDAEALRGVLNHDLKTLTKLREGMQPPPPKPGDLIRDLDEDRRAAQRRNFAWIWKIPGFGSFLRHWFGHE